MPRAGKPPLVLFEDDHLLAVNKPSGINTHKPDRYALDGIHEWLQKQRPEWRNLSVLHRLDKETSGVMVFGKTPVANRSLTEQFERAMVKKTYLFLTPGRDACATRVVSTAIQGRPARTSFRVFERRADIVLMEAQPTTGRTHQVRIHAAEAGFPVAGDTRYGRGGSEWPRLMLHAAKLEFRHPTTGEAVTLEAPDGIRHDLCNGHYINNDVPRFECARQFRELLFGEAVTNAYRLIAGAADGFPDLTADRFGDAILVRSSASHPALPAAMNRLTANFPVFVQDMIPGSTTKPQPLKAWCETLIPGAGAPPSSAVEISAQTAGDGRAPCPESFLARENGMQFVIRMDQGFSPGLFLDQRENRRHLREIAAGQEVLNCFAYTCSFSVAAAAGGANTTSVDLSKSYLEWGRENFRANGIDPAGHDFIYGDVFDWLKRFATRGRQWNIVLLDPPTFGTTKKGRVFRAAKNYRDLVQLAVKLVRPGGILFCSTNQSSVAPANFVETVLDALRDEKREAIATQFETQPFDFRVAEGEKPYLKTLWVRVR